MKKILFLLIMALVPFIYTNAVRPPLSDNNPYEIELEKKPITQGNANLRPRFLNTLEVYHYQVAGMIEIIHCGLGDTDIYILDGNDEIVYHNKLYSSNCSIASILLPNKSGIYTIEIDSEIIYGLGSFIIQ